MISTAMMLMVSGAIYQTLTITQRLTRAQAQQVGVQSSVRSASLVLMNEVKPLGVQVDSTGTQSDLLSLAPGAMIYRAERGVGFLCQPSTATQLRLGRQSFSGHRDPQPGRDSASVFLEKDPLSAADDAWMSVAITGVSSGSCPGAAAPDISLSVPPSVALEGLPRGTPIRIHEVMELRLYSSEGRSWLGMRSVSTGENIQPLSGPLSDGDGLRLEYLNAAGLASVTGSEVRSIKINLQGESEGLVSYGALEGEHARENANTQVILRNALP
jgi:hypothetical protein